MLNEATTKHPPHVPKVAIFCLGLGIIGLVTTWLLTLQTQQVLWDLGIREYEHGFWIQMSTAPLFNPLCWAGLYGIYRLRRP